MMRSRILRSSSSASADVFLPFFDGTLRKSEYAVDGVEGTIETSYAFVLAACWEKIESRWDDALALAERLKKRLALFAAR